MPSRKPPARPAAPGSPSPSASASTSASRQQRQALVVRLQIAFAVFGPMLLVGLWLQSKGFFANPGL